MARGQRFELNLDSDQEDDIPAAAPAANFDLVKDVTERDMSTTATPPAPPKSKTTATGFPLPRARRPISRFKQNSSAAAENSPSKERPAAPGRNGHASSTSGTLPPSERARIDRENKETLARMSETEIERERQELLSGGVAGLTSSLIERLLKRANIDSDTGVSTEPEDQVNASKDWPHGEGTPTLSSGQTAKPQSKKSRPKVSFADTEDQLETPSDTTHSTVQLDAPPSSSIPLQFPPEPLSHDPEAPPLHPPSHLQPLTSNAQPSAPPIHFPAPASQHASLDPSSDTFLTDLREKYFPNLTADPNTLAWMQPLSSTPSSQSPYSPEHDSLPPSALRFDFRGKLVPPSVAASLPSTLGLHHHGAAPEAAGYTVGELALLQRSAVTAQRCVAHQTLGRVLFRLGKGEFGTEGTELCEGMWTVVARERVLDSLMAEASRGASGADGKAGRAENAAAPASDAVPRSGSRTAWAIATEALWLWQRGGGRGRGGAEHQTR